MERTAMRSACRRRTERCGGAFRGEGLETLEPRLVLASYALGDYLAAADGDRWDFRGTSNGSAATATLNVRGDVQASAGAAFDMRIGSGFPGGDIERRIRRSDAGLFVLSEEAIVLGEGGRTGFAAPLRLLPLSFSDGERFDFSTPVSVTVLPEGTPTITGTLTGSVEILGTERVTTPAGAFTGVHARLTTRVQATIEGDTRTVDSTEDWWLTRSVGFVRIDSNQTTRGNGEAETNSYTIGLTSSNRLAAPGEIEVLGNGRAILNNDATPRAGDLTAFGSVRVEGGTRARVFTIRNLSATDTLELGSVTLAGSRASDFSVGQPSDRTLGPGESTTFRVSFDPAAAGIRRATVVIASNDSDENPFRFRIRGTGAAAPAAAAGTTVAVHVGSPIGGPAWAHPDTEPDRDRHDVYRRPGLIISGSNDRVHIRWSGLGVSWGHRPGWPTDVAGTWGVRVRINL